MATPPLPLLPWEGRRRPPPAARSASAVASAGSSPPPPPPPRKPPRPPRLETRWTWTSVVACEPLESRQHRTGWIRQFPLLCCRKLLLPERQTRRQRRRCHQRAGAICRRVPRWCQRRGEVRAAWFLLAPCEWFGGVFWPCCRPASLISFGVCVFVSRHCCCCRRAGVVILCLSRSLYLSYLSVYLSVCLSLPLSNESELSCGLYYFALWVVWAQPHSLSQLVRYTSFSCRAPPQHGRESQTPPPRRWTMQEGRLFRQAAPRVRHRPRPWSALAAPRLPLRAVNPAWTGAWEPFLRASCPLTPRR